MSWMFVLWLAASPLVGTDAGSCSIILQRYSAEIRASLIGSPQKLAQRMSYLRVLEKKYPNCFRLGVGKRLKRQRQVLSPSEQPNAPSPCWPVFQRYTHEMEQLQTDSPRAKEKRLRYLQMVEQSFPRCFQREKGKNLRRQRFRLQQQKSHRTNRYASPAPPTAQRYVRRPLRGALIPGLVMLPVGYGISLLIGVLTISSSYSAWLFVPIIGPLILSLATTHQVESILVLNTFLTIPQLVGAVLIIVGIIGKKEPLHPPTPPLPPSAHSAPRPLFSPVGWTYKPNPL